MPDGFQYIIPAFTSLVGAWIGAHLALAQFKSERTFDLRREWFSQMVANAFAAWHRTVDLRVHYEWRVRKGALGPADDYLSKLSEFNAALDALRFSIAEAAIYADEATLAAIHQHHAALTKSHQDTYAEMEHGEPASALVKGLNRQADAIRSISAVASRAARAHLGYPALPQSAFPWSSE